MKDNWSRAISIVSLAITVAIAIGGWVAAARIAAQGNENQRSITEQDNVSKQRMGEQTNLIQQAIASQANLTQHEIANLNVQRDYVQLAVNILRDEPSKPSRPLREFAVEILAKNSPVKLTAEMKSALLLEKLKVPPAGGFSANSFDSNSFGPGFGFERGQPKGHQPPGWQPDGVVPLVPRASEPAKDPANNAPNN